MSTVWWAVGQNVWSSLVGRAAVSAAAATGRNTLSSAWRPPRRRRYRERQLRGLATGSVSVAEFARAEEQRARNALAVRWRKDPRLPGCTIDLGPDEWDFREAASRRGVDVDALYPAVADWLRWKWKRYQKDRNDPAQWMRVCRETLPRKIEAAEAAAFWADLGGYDRRTRQGRELDQVLRHKGREAAQALVKSWRAAGNDTPRQSTSPPLGTLSVNPWRENASGEGSKRLVPDPKRPPAEQIPTPLPVIDTEPDPDGDGALLRSFSSDIRAMYNAIPDQTGKMTFLSALRVLAESPGSPRAWENWFAVVRKCWM